MADITLKFSDGSSHIYRDAPDSLTPDDVIARASKDFSGLDIVSIDRANVKQKAQEEQPGTVKSALAGLGAGFGRTVLGGQQLIGEGLEAVGAEKVGKYLSEDAKKGRAKLLEELKQYEAVSPVAAGVGQFVGEIVPTLPVGGAIAKGASMLPGAAKAAPLIEAIRTSGATGGNLATRAAGGAITGATTAAMVDQDSAALGGLLGGALPVVGAGLSRLTSTPAQTEGLQKAIGSAREAGYVIPPTQANPTLTNRLLEGAAGKLTTAQNASAKNQAVTNKLAARSLGVADDTPITDDLLESIRETAGKAYDAFRELPSKPSQAASTLLNVPAKEAIDPAAMVYDLRVARNSADAYFKSYGRTADPEALTKANMFKAEATKIENALEAYANSLGRKELLPDLKNARQLIAKTYSVQNAMNMTTGNVDARKLAKQLEKGKPLSEGLKQAAEFAQRFPKAAQAVEGMGSLPQTSPLDWLAGGGLAAATQNPAAMSAIGIRPVARAAALSPLVQNRLVQKPQTQNELIELLKQISPATAAALYSED